MAAAAVVAIATAATVIGTKGLTQANSINSVGDTSLTLFLLYPSCVQLFFNEADTIQVERPNILARALTNGDANDAALL